VIVLLSLGFAVVFGCGTYLMLKHDLVRLAIGVILMSNSANLFLVSMALTRGTAPIYPLPEGTVVSDPVVQALTLTAIVITFGVSAILLGLMYRVYLAHRTIDLDELTRMGAADRARFDSSEEGG
jgi:multicomponent Na+:H+ antiporter subunit C